MQSLIHILGEILLLHREWFESKGNAGIYADLSEKNLQGMSFYGAVLVEASFQGAKLSRADFSKADLRGANLQDAQLTQVQFLNTDLAEADIMYADLKGARLAQAKLAGAYLQGADLRETDVTLNQINLAYTDKDTLLPSFQ